MPNLSLSFFGPGQILDPNGDEIVLRGRKEFALLAYLALEPEHAHRREFLGGLLWPEMAEDGFRNNLRVTLSRLKNKLAERGVDALLVERQSVQFSPDLDFEIDTHRFQQLRATIDSHTHGTPSSCLTCFPQILEAVELYKGSFLQGFHVDDSYVFDDWMTLQRENFHRQTIELLGMLETAYLHQKEYRLATETARRRVAMDPLQEDAHRQLMRLLVYSGERHAALVQYETCRQVLDQELGVPPSEETADLYRQIRDGEFSPTEQSSNEQKSGRPTRIGNAKIISEQAPLQPIARTMAESGAETLPKSNAEESDANALTDASASSNLATFEAQLNRWGTVTGQKLFGIDDITADLLDLLTQNERPWVVSVDGIGGIGKTSIARMLSSALLDQGIFRQVLWVSAKQEEFHSDQGIQAIEQSALDEDQMVTELLSQLDETLVAVGDAETKRLKLMQLLQDEAVLVVVDNLETVADYQALVPTLTQLAEPSKVLITSRLSLRSYPDIYTRTLGELTQADTFTLIRHEASVRGLTILSSATEEHLQAIYDVVGGHPLALNLVLGQLSYLPLAQVLTGLQEAQGSHIEQLYSYIYWQAWQMLDDASRQLFLTLPIVYNGTFEQLGEASLLEASELSAALSRLIGLSLVQVAGDILEPRYRLHRLTETFLMNEVLKWQSR